MPLPHDVTRTLAAFALHRARSRDNVGAVFACRAAIVAGKEPDEDALRALVLWSQETRAVGAETDAILELAGKAAETLKIQAYTREVEAMDDRSA